jgi:hypothetical protein
LDGSARVPSRRSLNPRWERWEGGAWIIAGPNRRLTSTSVAHLDLHGHQRYSVLVMLQGPAGQPPMERSHGLNAQM